MVSQLLQDSFTDTYKISAILTTGDEAGFFKVFPS